MPCTVVCESGTQCGGGDFAGSKYYECDYRQRVLTYRLNPFGRNLFGPEAMNVPGGMAFALDSIASQDRERKASPGNGISQIIAPVNRHCVD